MKSRINSDSGYYVDCLLALTDDGIAQGNYQRFVADRILDRAQSALDGGDVQVYLDTFDILATARGALRSESPDCDYWN